MVTKWTPKKYNGDILNSATITGGLEHKEHSLYASLLKKGRDNTANSQRVKNKNYLMKDKILSK